MERCKFSNPRLLMRREKSDHGCWRLKYNPKQWVTRCGWQPLSSSLNWGGSHLARLRTETILIEWHFLRPAKRLFLANASRLTLCPLFSIIPQIFDEHLAGQFKRKCYEMLYENEMR
jgi:hypothetical protein